MIWGIAVMLGTAVSGCGSRPEATATAAVVENTDGEKETEENGSPEEAGEEIQEEAAGDIFTIGFVQGEEEPGQSRIDMEEYRKIFCEENGYELEAVNCGEDIEKQKETIREFIARQLDYIILAPAEEEGWDDVLKEAQYAGIPVIVVGEEIDADPARYDTWIGVDGKIQGLRAGAWLAEHMKNKEVNMAVLEDASDPAVGEKRKKGLKEAGKEREGWKIIGSQVGEDTKEDGKKATEALIDSYGGQFNVLICQGDKQAMGAMEAMDEAGIPYGADGEITILSFGGTKEGLKAVLEGKISCHLGGSPGQAEKTVAVIGQMRTNGTYEERESTGDQVFVTPGLENAYGVAATEEMEKQIKEENDGTK